MGLFDPLGEICVAQHQWEVMAQMQQGLQFGLGSLAASLPPPEDVRPTMIETFLLKVEQAEKDAAQRRTDRFHDSRIYKWARSWWEKRTP